MYTVQSAHCTNKSTSFFFLFTVFNKILFCVFDHVFRRVREKRQRNALFLEWFFFYTWRKRVLISLFCWRVFDVWMRFIRLAISFFLRSQNDIISFHFICICFGFVCLCLFTHFHSFQKPHEKNMDKMHIEFNDWDVNLFFAWIRLS